MLTKLSYSILHIMHSHFILLITDLINITLLVYWLSLFFFNSYFIIYYRRHYHNNLNKPQINTSKLYRNHLMCVLL